MKKTWQVPKLIILVRGTPAEMALQACKYFFTGTGPAANVTKCTAYDDWLEDCWDCTTMLNS